MNDKLLLAYFGHHKCGTSWMAEMLVDVCRQLGLKGAYVHNYDSLVEEFLKKPYIRFLFHVNADFEHLKHLPPFRGFHMVRDPRDLVVSGYFSHLYTHPLQDWLVNHRLELQKRDKDKGLLFEIESDITRLIMNHIRTWNYKQNNVMEIRMEKMTAKPEQTMVSVFEFLGILNNPKEVLKFTTNDLFPIVEKHNFLKKSGGREPGKVDITSHYRSGAPGDWKSHFKDFHKQAFKKHFQDVLELLNYEEDDSW